MTKTIEEQGGCAFPTSAINPNDGYIYQEGMTLRDWFAGLAMQGFVSYNSRITSDEVNLFALGCYEIADAMLAARGK